MAESQDSATFSSRGTAAVNRRHSVDGTLNPPRPPDCFQSYRRQFSDGAVGRIPPCSPSFGQSHGDEVAPPWEPYRGSLQSSFSDLPSEPSCFLSQSYSSYTLSYPLQQTSSRLYPQNGSSSSKYSLQSISTPPQQEGAATSAFPKPIYSYSILIFMALKNSKTGSLPVSEIYSFMTEHFPYFKTAPDGWKNSVRHNLSLNKCFEKVENKNGSSSRKGCLWALNPAKVEKMQEELHKWRRKDPVTMRRSMARPEDLNRLLGERKDKLRSLPPYPSPALLSRVAPFYRNTSSPCPAPLLPPANSPVQHPHYTHPCYFPPAAAANSFSPYSPCGQQSTATGNLNSPLAGKMPPVYGAALQAECGVAPRSMQDFLMDGDASYDIDMLNPTLTDLQLQGHLWEELRDDSLNPASEQNVPAPSASQDHLAHSRRLQVNPLVGQVTPGARCKAESEDGVGARHPVVCSGVESLAGYLTSCTASISLM
ncbi:unnamed protein product [Ophioblennius macclurei]